MLMAMPESSSTGAGRITRFLTVSLAREIGVLLCLSVMFPFMIHIIPVPGDAQLGPRLLPMFYAPLLATLWGRRRSAAAVALLAPWLNWALTAHPPSSTARAWKSPRFPGSPIPLTSAAAMSPNH